MHRKISLVSIFLIFLTSGIKSAQDIPYDICEGIQFGYLAHPDPTRCTEYIICFFENFYLFNCTNPRHIFYLPYTYCVPGDPETCQVLIDVTTSTTTTQSSTTTSTALAPTTTQRSPLDGICEGIYRGVISHPEYCTMLVICMNESPFPYSCPPPTEIFHNGTCVAGNPATCELYSAITTTSEITTTNEFQPTTTENGFPNNFCAGIEFQILPHPNNCYQLVICVNGQPLINSCPPQTPVFYDGTCVIGNPDTCEVFITTTTTTESTSTTTELVTTTDWPLPDDFCDGIDIRNLPHPNDCTRYVFCIYGYKIIRSCPEETVFHGESCVEGDSTTCEPFTTTTTESITTTTKKNPEDGICIGIELGTLEYPGNCTLFILCVRELPNIYSCPNQTVFFDGFCVAGDPNTCQIITTTTTTTELPTTTSTTTVEPIITEPDTTTTENPMNRICDGTNHGFLPYPDDCTRFIFCMNEDPTIISCPNNTVFYYESCVDGDPTTCKIFTTTTTTERGILDDFCLDKPNLEFFPHPEDCSQFILCMNENEILNQCPDQTIFHDGSCMAGNPQICLPDRICSEIVNGFLPHPEDCNQFVFCMNGHLLNVFSCEDENIFSNGTCVAGNSKTCLPDDFCHGHHIVSLPHPNNCFQFVLCMNEHPIVNDCPSLSPVFHNGACTAGDPATCEVLSLSAALHSSKSTSHY